MKRRKDPGSPRKDIEPPEEVYKDVEVMMVPGYILDSARKLADRDDPEGALLLLQKNIVLSSDHPVDQCMANLSRHISIQGRPRVVNKRLTTKHWNFLK